MDPKFYAAVGLLIGAAPYLRKKKVSIALLWLKGYLQSAATYRGKLTKR